MNPNLPSSITKGDNYEIVGTYMVNGSSNGSYFCGSDKDGVVSNISELTTIGTHRVYCTASTGAKVNKTADTYITITYEPYTITNLITNGSFENGTTNWNLDQASIVSGGYDGNHSLEFSYRENTDLISMSTQILSQPSPILNHNYYGSVMFKSTDNFSTDDSRYEWYHSDSGSGIGTLVFGKKNIKTTTWTKISSIGNISNSTYLSNTWTIRNFQRGTTNYSYCDALILIDLTATFGEGNEPNKEWCDKHINYFDGTTTIYK